MYSQYKVWAKGAGSEIVKKHSHSDERKTYRDWYNQTEAGRANKRKYMQKLCSTVEGRLQQNIRRRMAHALQSQGTRKGDERSMQYVGCTASELKEHLEGRFLPGMTWENKSLWQMDHVVPLASFDLSKEEERHRAFHFSNIQPLFTKDNMKKSDLMPDGSRARHARITCTKSASSRSSTSSCS